MHHKALTQALARFNTIDSPSTAALTLGGTGPNGCSQVMALETLGKPRVQQLGKINIISGSAFGYFIWQAFHEQQVRRRAFSVYDGLMRRAHNASFFKGLALMFRASTQREPVYDNVMVKNLAHMLLSQSYCQRPLSSFEQNIGFWAYCSNREACICITPKDFPEMQVWEVVSGVSSAPLLHGQFEYKDYRLSDPIFSKDFKKMTRQILNWSGPHLYMNNLKNAVSGNVDFVRNESCVFPAFALYTDFLRVACNIPNSRVHNTHRKILSHPFSALAL